MVKIIHLYPEAENAMQVEVETLPNCITALHVEVPPERVNQERQTILRDYQGAARLPGYRPGKAPKSLVESRFKKEIAEELQRKVVSSVVREAAEEKKLRVLSFGEAEQVELSQDNTLRFTARVVTAPEFELPPYQGLSVKVPPAEITDADIDNSLNGLRQRLADFSDITDRGLQMDDFSVIDFAGRVEGQPLAEVAPDAPKELSGKENFWIKLGPQTLLPGFSEALAGAKADETREFSLDVPEDFPLEALRGKKVDYTVKVRELKQQSLPELDDAFAEKVIPGKTLVELRDVARQSLQGERHTQVEEIKRRQIVGQLVGGTDFELPNDFVRGETRRIMNDIVKQNQERGVSDEEIRDNEKNIVDNAGAAARQRLKSAFILVRIAEKEGIKVTQEELLAQVNALAQRYQMPREKLIRNLQERNAFGQIEEEILLGKTLAFLVGNAKVETVALDDPALKVEDDEEAAEVSEAPNESNA